MEASTDPPELRPLSLGEILDAAFKLYKRHFKTLCLCVLVVVVPLAVISTLLTASLSDDPFDPTPEADPGASFGGTEIAALGATVLIAILLSTLATAAATRAVAVAYLGGSITWQESLRFALRKAVPLIVLSFLTGLAVILGLIALILPGIYIGVRLFLASPALVVEDESARGAMKRSWALVKDRWWPTFGVIVVSLLLIGIIAGLLQGLIIAPLFADSDNAVLGAVLNTLGTVVGNVITIPLQAAVLTILYFDLRVRKEGFDLALLSQRVGGDGIAAPSTATGTSPEDVSRSAGLGGGEPPRSSGGFTAPEERDRP